MVVILLLIALIIWFGRVKEGSCVLIFANIGAGKTTLLARYAQRELKKIKKGKSKYKYVISNTPISGVTYIPKIRKLLQNSCPENTLILVDEAGIVWNNRKMKITDEEIEYIKLIRHYQSKIIAISQSHEDVDITIRRLYTNIYLLNKVLPITLLRPIKKYVTIDKETEQIVDGYKFRFINSWGILYRRRYYNCFDTYWKPDNNKVHPDFSEYKVVEYNKKKFMEIRNRKEKKTKNNITSPCNDVITTRPEKRMFRKIEKKEIQREKTQTR